MGHFIPSDLSPMRGWATRGLGFRKRLALFKLSPELREQRIRIRCNFIGPPQKNRRVNLTLLVTGNESWFCQNRRGNQSSCSSDKLEAKPSGWIPGKEVMLAIYLGSE
jgi:hypothetical protein